MTEVGCVLILLGLVVMVKFGEPVGVKRMNAGDELSCWMLTGGLLLVALGIIQAVVGVLA